MGDRGPSRMNKTQPATGGAGRWTVGKLALLLYPAAAAAVWINLFMLSLLMGWLGVPRLTPGDAALAALPLGLPVALLAGRWVRRLMDRAEGR